MTIKIPRTNSKTPLIGILAALYFLPTIHFQALSMNIILQCAKHETYNVKPLGNCVIQSSRKPPIVNSKQKVHVKIDLCTKNRKWGSHDHYIIEGIMMQQR